MFIEQALRTQNPFWKYLVGILLIIIASLIGQLPFTVAILAKSMELGMGFNVPSDQLMTLLDSNLSLFLMMLAYAATLGGIFLTVRVLHQQSLTSLTTARPRIDWKRFGFSFGIWAVFSIVSVAVSYAMNPQDYVWNFKPIPFLILVLIGTIMIPLQTSAEEYLFRGYLMQGLGWIGNKWFPLLFTSVVFGGLHFFNPEVDKMGHTVMIYYIGTGLFLGIITLMDDGMELALGFHAANNLLGALLVTSDWTVFQTHSLLKDVSQPAAGADVILPVFVVYPILLLIFSRKYDWSQWREKLTGSFATPHSKNLKKSHHGTHDHPDPNVS